MKYVNENISLEELFLDIHYPSVAEIDQHHLMDSFLILAKDIFLLNSVKTDSKAFISLIGAKDYIFHLWNMNPYNRVAIIHRFVRIISGNEFPYFQSKVSFNWMTSENLSSVLCDNNITANIIQILEDCFNIIPDISLMHFQEKRILIDSVLPNKKINFLEKLKNSLKEEEDELSGFWRERGIHNSNDKEFFQYLWEDQFKLNPSSFKTDKSILISIISNASRCDYFPMKIFNDIVSKKSYHFHLYLSSSICSRLDAIKKRIKSFESNDSLTIEELLKQLEFHNNLIRRLSSCSNPMVINNIIRHMDDDLLLFIMPLKKCSDFRGKIEERLEYIREFKNGELYKTFNVVF